MMTITTGCRKQKRSASTVMALVENSAAEHHGSSTHECYLIRYHCAGRPGTPLLGIPSGGLFPQTRLALFTLCRGHEGVGPSGPNAGFPRPTGVWVGGGEEEGRRGRREGRGGEGRGRCGCLAPFSSVLALSCLGVHALDHPTVWWLKFSRSPKYVHMSTFIQHGSGARFRRVAPYAY